MSFPVDIIFSLSLKPFSLLVHCSLFIKNLWKFFHLYMRIIVLYQFWKIIRHYCSCLFPLCLLTLFFFFYFSLCWTLCNFFKFISQFIIPLFNYISYLMLTNFLILIIIFVVFRYCIWFYFKYALSFLIISFSLSFC